MSSHNVPTAYREKANEEEIQTTICESRKMYKPKENMFLEKFSSLNSQEHSEDINWSTSSSSEYEDMALNDKSINRVSRTRVKKRKRKKKMPNNISNLSITILDTSRESKKVISEEKSPILVNKVRCKSRTRSPILKPIRSRSKPNIISSTTLTSEIYQLKSPVLVIKNQSPKSNAKVRKKLFKIQNSNKNVTTTNKDVNIEHENFDDKLLKNESQQVIKCEIDSSPIIEFEEINENQSRNDNTPNAKLELVKRVKSFFDSHFSSQNSSTSLNSISDIVTPQNSTKTSDEIEIFTCKSQVPSNNNSLHSLKQENSANSSESSLYNFNKNAKKVRYRKDGHAYRLNNLLKKQNASLALWQHERYLAANSNFVIPKGEFNVFRIQKVHFKYGCHLIESVGLNDDKYLILINSCYVLDKIDCKTVLKLYEPYKIVQYNSDCRLIINVTKFECSSY